MKFVCLLHSFLKKVRFSGLVLAIMMTFSIFLGVMTLSMMQYLSYDYHLVKDVSPDVYYAQAFRSPGSMTVGQGRPAERGNRLMADLRALAAVEYAYGVRSVSPLSYQEEQISISLWDPGLLDVFPALRRMGFDFSKNENGCIFFGSISSKVQGNTVDFTFTRPTRQTESFSVCGFVGLPSKRISLSVSSTSHTMANDLFKTGDVVVMLATDAVVQKLEGVSTIGPYSNCVYKLREDATEAEIQEVQRVVDQYGLAVSMETVTQNTLDHLRERQKEALPLPIFLLMITIVAYLSMVILLVKKKEKELSVIYLCGASKRKCVWLIILSMMTFSVGPMLLNAALVVVGVGLQRRGIISLQGYYVTYASLVLVILYFVMTVLISFLTVTISMRKQTPVSYMKGAAS